MSIVTWGAAVKVTVLVIHGLSGQTLFARDFNLKVTDPLV